MFERAALGIGRLDEPLAGRSQLGDVEAEPVERFPQRLNVRSLQVIDLLLDDFRSCASSKGRRQAAQHPISRDASLLEHSPAATVVPVAATS